MIGGPSESRGLYNYVPGAITGARKSWLLEPMS